MKRILAVLSLCLLIVGVASAAAGDTILFEQVNISSNITQVWNNGTFQVFPVVQGVTTTDNIDVSKLAFDTLAGIYPPNDMRGQQFQPTKSQISKVALNLTMIGSPEGDVEVSIRTNNASGYPTNTILASTTITATSISESPSAYTEFSVPCVVPTDAQLWVVVRSTSGTWNSSNFIAWGRIAGGPYTDRRAHGGSISGVWSGADNNFQFQTVTYYAKNTESVNVTVNGNTKTIDTGDAFGMLSGSDINLYTKTFTYNNGFNTTDGKFSDVYIASPGGYTTSPVVIDGWGWTNTAESIQSASDTTARNVTFKINTILPVTGLDITVTGFNNNVNTGLVELSGDGSTYTTVWDLPASASAQTSTVSTGHVNGNTSIYLRLSKDTTNGYIRWDDLKVVALVNTTSIETSALVYFNGTNTVNLTSDGRAVSSSLDPSLMANVSLIAGEGQNPIFSFFSMFNSAGTAPHTTYLYDQSTNLTGSETFGWVLGDGNTSASKNLYYTWNITGVYTVNHSVSNGVTTSYSQANVTVGTPTPPVVEPVASYYGGPQLGNPPLKVFFTDVSSNTPTSWNWSFGDGTYSESQNPEHWFNRSGLYRVNLTATNSAGSNLTSQSNFVIVY